MTPYLAQLLDEHPPQLLELHELELQELDELQLDDESLELQEEPVDPPARAAAGANGDGSISTIECAAHAVPTSAPAPNSAAVHSNASGLSRSSLRTIRRAASDACPPTVRPGRPNPVSRPTTTRYAMANAAMQMTSNR
ncbi:MAG: hypothetical protein IOC30_25115, partial [Burkholderia sp.]|nr:hypothetical protein [Burkholderia sp.]